MTVADVMNANPFYPGFLRSPIHLMVQVALGKREQPCMLVTPIQHPEIIFHLKTEELRQFNRAVAFFRLRACDIILALQMLK